MANLYDLELQESNNFIMALCAGGTLPALKLMKEQVTMFEGMGEAGKAILDQMKDPNSDMGKSYARMSALEIDLIAVMQNVGLTPDLAQSAQSVLTTNPDSLQSLEGSQRAVVQDYWLKKKTCIAMLINKGYTPQELFS